MKNKDERSKNLVMSLIKENPEWSATANSYLWKLKISGNISTRQFNWVMKRWGRQTLEDRVIEVFDDAIVDKNEK